MKLKIKKYDKEIKNLKGLKKSNVAVGWFEESKYDDNTKIADVAFYQEYGTSRNIPQRPFMRPAEMKNEKTWKEIVKNGVKSIIKNGGDIDSVMGKLGLKVQGDIQEAIIAVQSPALKESTIKARISRKSAKQRTASIEKPLIDTGTMLAAVQHKVNVNG